MDTVIECPPHYDKFHHDPLTIAAMYELSPCLSHAIKYLLRAGHKGDRVEDLKKCLRCVEMELEYMNRKKMLEEGYPREEVWRTKL